MKLNAQPLSVQLPNSNKLSKRFIIEVISSDNLKNIFNDYKPNFNKEGIEEIFNRTYELCFNPAADINFTNVLHLCYDLEEKKYCAILNIGTTTAVDDIVSINVEFLFVEPEYRGEIFEELADTKLSEYLLLDYVVGTIGQYSKKNLGIGWVALTPVNDKVREIYTSYGFQKIDGSGKHELEDWMVFNI